MIFIMSITLAAGGIMGHRSFERGFIGYLNDLQGERLEFLAGQIESDYASNLNWTFLNTEERNWQLYIRSNLSPESSRAEEHKRGMGRGKRNSDHDDDSLERDSRMLSRSLSLLDANESLIAGAPLQKNDRSLLTPLYNDTTLIGHLRFQPFAELTESLDRSFAEQRKKSFLLIGAFSLIFTAFASWFFSRFFRTTILHLTDSATKMASGDYSQRIELKRNDEIGQLAQSFNVLSHSLEKNQQARQQWIADISHELRTPLAVLRGELEALEDGIRELTPAAVTSLTSEVSNLNKLVDDLYELSLSDLGALNYQLLDTDPSDVLASTFNTFQSRFDSAQIESSIDVQNKNTKTLADESRLNQLFTNLLENSVRYTDTGGKVKATCSVENNQWVMRLEDSSPSVEADHIPHLFERFYRTDSSRGRMTGGAGLGLAIVSEIVEAHSGSIEAHPSDLGGLLIVLKIPINHA